MGTRLALEYLVAHPRRTGGIVLLSPINPRPWVPARDSAVSPDHAAKREEFASRDICRKIRHDEGVAGPDSVVEEFGDQAASRRWRIDFTCANAVHVERWELMEGGRAYYDVSAGRAAARSMSRAFDATQELAKHECPVHVIAGARDWIIAGGEMVRHLYEEIPGTAVRILDDASHAIWLDAPNRFPSSLDSALAAVTSCSR